MLNWRRDPSYEQRMKLLKTEIEDAKRLALESEQRTKLLDEKLRNFYALELRLKHGKPSSPTASTPPQSCEPSSCKR